MGGTRLEGGLTSTTTVGSIDVAFVALSSHGTINCLGTPFRHLLDVSPEQTWPWVDRGGFGEGGSPYLRSVTCTCCVRGYGVTSRERLPFSSTHRERVSSKRPLPPLGPVDEMKRVSEAAYPISSTDQKRLRPELDFHDSPTPLDEPDDDLPKAPKGWEPHREPTEYKSTPVPTVKAYKNTAFLNSPHARSFRMLAEYEETMQRLASNGVSATVQFFGSARALDREQYDKKLLAKQAAVAAAAPGSPEANTAGMDLQKLEAMEWMIPYLDKTRELARRLTEWSIRSRLSRDAASLNGVSRNKSLQKELDKLETEAATSRDVYASPLYLSNIATARGMPEAPRFTYLPHCTEGRHATIGDGKGALFVCTGGAGGFMEAANRGASDVPGGRSIGMGISLPFETGKLRVEFRTRSAYFMLLLQLTAPYPRVLNLSPGLNPYVTPELAFEYHCECLAPP